MTPLEYQQQLKSQIYKSYNVEPIQKSTQEEEIGKAKDIEVGKEDGGKHNKEETK